MATPPTRDASDPGAGVLVTRAREAPTRPGVYFLLGPQRELLYAGKATTLRRRLLDHSRTGRRWPVDDVAWIECADEDEALCLEADVITALAPPLNAVMAADAFNFVRVDPVSPSQLRFTITGAAGNRRRTYGAFPHLGKGKGSWRAVRTNAGYASLLRLLWVAFAESHRRTRIPSRLRGTSPPLTHDAPVAPERVTMLRDFLTGRSARLVAFLRDAVTADDIPAFMRGPLADDLAGAEQFYRLGPHALRRLRLRHRLPAGPVAHETFERIVLDDVTRAIGSIALAPRPIGSKRGDAQIALNRLR